MLTFGFAPRNIPELTPTGERYSIIPVAPQGKSFSVTTICDFFVLNRTYNIQETNIQREFIISGRFGRTGGRGAIVFIQYSDDS